MKVFFLTKVFELCVLNLLLFPSFVDADLCDDKPCDLNTTTCKSGDGAFTCTCLDKYVPSKYSDRMCIGKGI